MTEEELCPEAKEYLEWFDKEALPRYLKYAAHVVNCSRCQEQMLSGKDQMAFQMLTMSDQETLQMIRKALRGETKS